MFISYEWNINFGVIVSGFYFKGNKVLGVIDFLESIIMNFLYVDRLDCKGKKKITSFILRGVK